MAIAEFDVRSLGTVYRFWVIGKTPLLTHNPAGMLVPTGGLRKGERKIPSPEEEAASGAYRTDGGFAVPAAAFREATMRAARDFEVPSKKRVGRRRPVLSDFLGHVTPTEELLLLVDPDTKKPLADYAIDTRRVVVQRQGVMRSRPKFWPWACTLEVVGDPRLIADDDTGPILLQALRHAGTVNGVCEYRPSQGGPFGRFDAQLVVAPRKERSR